MPNPEMVLRGNLASDPEFKTFSTGNLLKFRVVTNERTQDQNGNWVNKDTSGWNVEVWGNLADKWNNNLQKGSGVQILGKARERQFEDKTGSKRSVVEIKATSVGLTDVKGSTPARVTNSSDDVWDTSGSTPF